MGGDLREEGGLMMKQSLLVELLVEELPPKALKNLGRSFSSLLEGALREQGVLTASSATRSFASPRRLAVLLTQVCSQAEAVWRVQKMMPISVAFDAQQKPSAALLKKVEAMSVDKTAFEHMVKTVEKEGLEGLRMEVCKQEQPLLRSVQDGKNEVLVYEALQEGVILVEALQQALTIAVQQLPIPKVMTYPLLDESALSGWNTVKFVRPVHSLVVLYGQEVLPVSILGLKAGAKTRGHRFQSSCDELTVTHADDYERVLAEQGSVMACFEKRRAYIVEQLNVKAAMLGEVKPIEDEALLDEVTALVEFPHVLACDFDEAFLEVPQECLILTMKANQKYFPLLDKQGRLTHHFLMVSNIAPQDSREVIAGNERVVRSRLADAQFFFQQDQKKTLRSRCTALSSVVYHARLGSQADRLQRVERIVALVLSHLQALGGEVFSQENGARVLTLAQEAAQLCKADLLTDMVGEFPELQGIMGAYYARHEGLDEEVAMAIEDHYKPRFAGDALPRSTVGAVLALSDKLETIVGLFGIGQQPTGDKDPFALRRHALGVLRMVIENGWAIRLGDLIEAIELEMGALIKPVKADVLDFMKDRLESWCRDQGYTAQEVKAVLAIRADEVAKVSGRLLAVRRFVSRAESEVLANANKRVSNILKKSTQMPKAQWSTLDEKVWVEEPERVLWQTLKAIEKGVDEALALEAYDEFWRLLSTLQEPITRFFDEVMVHADDERVRFNRLGLLAHLHQEMNRVADLSCLAV